MSKSKKARNAAKAYALGMPTWVGNYKRKQIIEACADCQEAARQAERAILDGEIKERLCPAHINTNTKKGFGSAITKYRWKKDHSPSAHRHGAKYRS